MSLRPKKSIVLAVQAEEFFPCEGGRVTRYRYSLGQRGKLLGEKTGGEALRLWVSKAVAYPMLDLLGGYP